MQNKNLNFIFWGTPEVASETLEILKEAGFLPSLIITASDKPKGRKMILTPPPVKVWAIENNIPYLQPENLKNLPRTWFRGISPEPGSGEIQPELSIVVAYGKIIPEEILNIPKLGSVNIHYSLLPKYRGASPVESAILNADIETGVSIQQMEYKMDSGPILAQEKTAIAVNEKTSELRNRLIKIGGELLVKILPYLIEKKITPTLQDENLASFCKKIKKEDGEINLDDNGEKNYNKFRAYATWPRTFFMKDGKRIIITDAILENGEFKILKVIPEGKKETNFNTLK